MSTAPPPLVVDSASLMPECSQIGAVGALWRRMVAAFIDSLIVGLVGTIVALPFFDAFSRLGPWGRLVGFCLALLYFGVFNSKIGNGQTLGKRIMNLRVVDGAGSPISIAKSIVRFAVLGAPFFLNQLTLPISRTPQFVIYVLSIIIFGQGFVLIYLILFNRNTRQGLHDLLVGSYVAQANRAGVLSTKSTWKGHWVVLGVLIVAGCVGANAFQKKIVRLADFPAMMADVGLIEKIPNVQSAGVSDLTWTSSQGDHRRKIYVVRVVWSGSGMEEEKLANLVADKILQHDPNVLSRDSLQINVVHGYDLGIAHAQTTRTFEDTPQNWKLKLHASPQSGPTT